MNSLGNSLTILTKLIINFHNYTLNCNQFPPIALVVNMKIINRTNKSHNPQNQSNCFKKIEVMEI